MSSRSSAIAAHDACLPRKVWDFQEIMNTFDAWGIAIHLQKISSLRERLEAIKGRGGGGSVPAIGQLHEACSVIDNVAGICQQVGFLDAVQNIQPIILGLGNIQREPPDVSTVLQLIEQLDRVVCKELSAFRFVSVNPKSAELFEQDRLFGNAVYAAFKDARQELKDAGNCIALELYDAAIFHLIRVSEYGLRALARRLRARLTDKGRPQRIEYADWNKIIKACKDKIEESRKLSVGPKKLDRLQLYSDAADHCEYMKDLWRNNISHARRRYLYPDALAAFDRVRAFTVFLAEKVLIP